jgi:hypothetical protein
VPDMAPRRAGLFESASSRERQAAKHRRECNHGADIDHKHRRPRGSAIIPIATMVADATAGPPLRRGADRAHYPTLCVQVAGAMAVAALALVVGRFSAWPSQQHAGAEPSIGLVPAEYKPDSFGVLNGRIVALDYG